MRYMHMERVNDSMWRFQLFVTNEGLRGFLESLTGLGIVLCQDVTEHGHRKMKTMSVEDVLENKL